MTLAAHTLYTGGNRVRPVGGCIMAHSAYTAEWLVASRLTAKLKGSGVGDIQDDTYAIRRAQLEAQFRALPPVGDIAYWRRIEGVTEHILPLEVLARCFRERAAAGAIMDTERIFNVIVRHIQSRVGGWAWKVAQHARSGMKKQLQEDLEQQCYMKLWEELASDGRTFLLERFPFALERLWRHVAHDMMEQAGEWRRRGVETPTRIPRAATDSIEAKPKGEDDVPLVEQITDTTVQDAFDQAELSDLFDLVMNLPEEQRTIILDRFWDGRSQEETAAKLGISDRMVRYRLKTILLELGVRYRGGEEGNHA